MNYGNADHPTAPSQIGHERYTYDANGNPTLVEDDSLNMERRMAWDEENRLTALSDNGKTSRYTYNAAGERIVKSHGYLGGVYVTVHRKTSVSLRRRTTPFTQPHSQRYAPVFHQALLGVEIGIDLKNMECI